jgi:hypothetical protein
VGPRGNRTNVNGSLWEERLSCFDLDVHWWNENLANNLEGYHYCLREGALDHQSCNRKENHCIDQGGAK